MKRNFLAFALSVLMLLSLTSCGGNTRENSPSVPYQTEEQPPNTSSVAEDESVSEPEPEFVSISDPVEFTGTGDDVIELSPYDDVYVFYIVGNTAGKHFSVATYDENGNYGELLVNTTDPYFGIVFEQDQSAAMLEISATGDWEITQMSIYTLSSYGSGDTISGANDAVFLVTDSGKTASITGNSDARFFAVYGYGANSSELLVNTTDPYEGSVMLKCDPVLMVVNAEGKWSITLN